MPHEKFTPKNNNAPIANQTANQNSRRRFIYSLGSVLSLAAIEPVFALTNMPSAKEHRSLELHHLHTGETLTSTYWNGLDYDSAALESINHVLRDFRTNDVYPIDGKLLDILHTVRTELGVDAPFEVIGGYRSPKTNAMLRQRSNGVAKKSLHMQGRAIDVRMPDVNSAKLREVAADLHLGGVGYYRSSNFVHLDTGRPRVW